MASGERRSGFTLIELLVVLAITALLLTLAAPRYFGALDRSKEVVLRDSLDTLRRTIQDFHGDKSRYPRSLEELVREGYLRRVPVDPITESAETWVELPPPTGQGMADVRSGSPGVDKQGVRYADW